MIKLKDNINKSNLFRQLKQLADKKYEGCYEPDLCKEEFLKGAETTINLIRKNAK